MWSPIRRVSKLVPQLVYARKEGGMEGGDRESSEVNGKFAKLTSSFVPPEEYLRERTVHGPGSPNRARDSHRGRG